MNDQKQPKVSVIVAVYNIEAFIGECIKSIVDQTYRNLEIIIVDDCSSDKSGVICDDFAKFDNRIKVIHHETNRRLPAVRNTGLENATGEYIVMVDGDDWLAIDFVEYMLELIVDSNSDMGISCNNFTTRDLHQVKTDKKEIWSPEKATAEFLYPHISIGAWNKIYKRAFIEKNKLRFREDHFTAEGYRFINEAAQRANQIAVGQRKVYYYRLNNIRSATTKPDIRQGTGSLYALECIERDLIIRTPYVMNGLYEHRWTNMNYTLRLILETKSKKENKELYHKCKQYMRQNGAKVAANTKFFKRKMKIYITSIFPILVTYYQLLHKKVSLYIDVKRNNHKLT